MAISLITPRGMVLLCLVMVLVFAVLIQQINGEIEVATYTLTDAAGKIYDAAGGAADQIKDKAESIFSDQP